MADIFLSYASEDIAKAKLLAEALQSKGWTVFWDRQLLAGEYFHVQIEQEIQAASCMIVAWSVASNKSKWVRSEVGKADKRGILVPILFELIEPPMPYDQVHAEDFSAWHGELNNVSFNKLQQAVAKHVQPLPVDFSPVEPNSSAGGTKTGHATGKQSGGSTNEDGRQTFKIKFGKQTLAFSILTLVIAAAIKLSGSSDSDLSAIKKADTQNQDTVAVKESAKSVTNNNNVHAYIEPIMVKIPAGEFMMGSADKDKNADANEKKQHKVKITAFSLGKYEVTKAEYAAFMQDASYEVKGGCYIWADAKWQLKPEFNWHNPGFTQADNEPVTCVSYEDAKAYIQWLNTKTEKTYRLPSEAEWEYAARAKTTGDYYWGSADSKDYAWYGDNAELKTHPVGKKKPNDYGLYDMSGNVWEWVQDNWRENYQRTPDDGSAWETAEADAPRVVRGGSWGDKLLNLSSAQRGRTNPDICGSYLGFRLAQD